LFEKRLDELKTAYKESAMAIEFKPSVDFVLGKNDNSFNVSLVKQFMLLFKRAFISQIRNPLDFIMKSF